MASDELGVRTGSGRRRNVVIHGRLDACSTRAVAAPGWARQEWLEPAAASGCGRPSARAGAGMIDARRSFCRADAWSVGCWRPADAIRVRPRPRQAKRVLCALLRALRRPACVDGLVLHLLARRPGPSSSCSRHRTLEPWRWCDRRRVGVEVEAAEPGLDGRRGGRARLDTLMARTLSSLHDAGSAVPPATRGGLRNLSRFDRKPGGAGCSPAGSRGSRPARTAAAAWGCRVRRTPRLQP